MFKYAVALTSLVFVSPLMADGEGAVHASGHTLQKSDADTNKFIGKLNKLDPRSEKGQEIQDREERKKNILPSQYGRSTPGKISGKISPGKIERPGAALGGNSSYSR